MRPGAAGKYRADGSMRPAAARYEQRRERQRRTEWLDQFEPGARRAFFEAVDMDCAVFASPMSRHLGLSVRDTEAELARLADERGWLRLETRDGRVVGIGPEK